MQGNLYNRNIYVYFTIVLLPFAAIIALCLDSFFSWLGFSSIFKIIVGTPSAIAVLMFVLNFFDTRAWKWRIFTKLNIVTVPNLCGRWKGTVDSSHNQGSKHEAIIEIHQTFSKICVNLYTATSESHTVIGGFLKDESQQARLYYLYQNVPRAVSATSSMIAQQGSAILKVLNDGKSLEGCYYNNGRERNTFGEMKFEWIQKNVIHSYNMRSGL